MAIKVDNEGVNIFPDVEDVDANDTGQEVEMTLLTKIEGRSTPVAVRLSYKQAADLSTLLAIFGK
jgi:hypothetical protein